MRLNAQFDCKCSFSFHFSVNVDDGTPRFPLTFRVPLCYTVLRLKEIIESQEGLGISEQTILLDENEV